MCGGEPGDEATFNICNIQYYTNIIVAMSMQHCNYYNIGLYTIGSILLYWMLLIQVSRHVPL